MRKSAAVAVLTLLLVLSFGDVEVQAITCKLCDARTSDWKTPLEISSSFGGIRATLEIDFAKHQIGDDTVNLRSYIYKEKAHIPGPTFRFKAGETLSILLKNKLPVVSGDKAKFDVTNFHTHGFHISPKCQPDKAEGPWDWCSDNVLIRIDPKEEVQFKFALPKDHHPGTNWYHPHKHGATAVQVTSGMSGALIVEGDVDKMLRTKGIQERLFVFQQIEYDDNGEVKLCQDVHNCPLLTDDFTRNTTINGQVKPLIKLLPGQVERWRFIHAGIKGALNIVLVKAKDEGCSAEYSDDEELLLHEFAADGITMGWVAKRRVVEMFPGYRSDVLAQVLQPGDYCLLDKETSDNTMDLFPGRRELRQVLAMVKVEGPTKAMKMPVDADFKPLAPFEPLCNNPNVKIDTKQTSVFAQGWTQSGGWETFFNVNGVVFTSDMTPRTLKLKHRDEWTLTSVVDSHPFHIHQNPFQVCEILNKGTNLPAAYPNKMPVLYANRPVWRDTVIVPHWQKVIFRTHYTDFTGKFVQHCHILTHEDLGMMQLIEITE